MSKKSTEVSTQVSQEVLDQINSAYPVEQGGLRINLPRLSMASQDVKEGKGKAMKVVTEAGTFFTERQTDEINEETGKKVWAKDEIGREFEGIIVFKRKQLRYYDESTEQYTSSPIYDSDDDIVPLFCDKKEIARGTPKELQANYLYTTKEGKERSKLEENRILYVLYNDELHQLNLRGSSMYSLMSYERSTSVPTVLTRFGSEYNQKGTIEWNKMTFKAVRPLTAEEAERVISEQVRLKTAIAMEKASYANAKKSDDDLDALADEAAKALGSGK
jgi:hypothetical protein